jgi:hypothetical protein
MLKPRSEVSVIHFAVKMAIYTWLMFVVGTVLLRNTLWRNLVFALGFGLLTVIIEGFLFMATGGRQTSD